MRFNHFCTSSFSSCARDRSLTLILHPLQEWYRFYGTSSEEPTTPTPTETTPAEMSPTVTEPLSESDAVETTPSTETSTTSDAPAPTATPEITYEYTACTTCSSLRSCFLLLKYLI